jgi:hypothetical protein
MALLHSITIGTVRIFEADANPNGVNAASKGSLATDKTSGITYENVDGGTTWVIHDSPANPVDFYRFGLYNQLNG